MTEKGYYNCHFCGDFVRDGLTPQGERHHLSDCRPDLVAHEPGDLCTWPEPGGDGDGNHCYAYQDRTTRKWGGAHIHFYPDGPM